MSNPQDMGGSRDLAAVFRALSDPYRLSVFSILQRVARSNGAGPDASLDMSDVIEETAYATNMSPSVIEHHLLDLARARLVIVDESADGRVRVRVDRETVAAARQIVSGIGDAGESGEEP